jgi:hypothetical protein
MTGNRAAESAAETQAMRMIQSANYSRFIALLVIAVSTTLGGQLLLGQAPMVRHANVDFEASGYVTPAGMVPPEMYQGAVMPVGYANASSCDGGYCPSGGCDSCGPMAYQSYGGCDSCDGCNSCDGYYNSSCGDCCSFRMCDMFHKLASSCDCMSLLRHCCMFCGGDGCSACQFVVCKNVLAGLHCLLPYTEAGLCAQRWYDFSAEALFLGHNNGFQNFAVTSQGVDGDRVLFLDDADLGSDLEAGMRLSAAMIFGAGGNLEGTYMGNNRWSSRASVTDPNFQLFSFISGFGTNPPDNAGTPEFDAGFDDTDRSQRQSVANTSEFHSGELNYRRRTVGPYCRFQGSWLVGLRYLRFSNGLTYSALGANDNTVNADLPRFFSSNDEIKNEMWGPQGGFDLWWNMIPGINLGFGMKGAWVRNDVERRTILRANSLGPVATAGTRVVDNSTHDTTVMGELEAKVIYRLTHSWSLRSAYYLVAVDDVGFSTTDTNAIRNFLDPVNNPDVNLDLGVNDLVVQGFSFGAEYIW